MVYFYAMTDAFRILKLMCFSHSVSIENQFYTLEKNIITFRIL